MWSSFAQMHSSEIALNYFYVHKTLSACLKPAAVELHQASGICLSYISYKVFKFHASKISWFRRRKIAKHMYLQQYSARYFFQAIVSFP